MLQKIKALVARYRRLFDYGVQLLEDARKSNALAAHFDNQNAILYGLTELMKRSNQSLLLELELKKSNQLLNLAASELKTFSQVRATLEAVLPAIRRDISNLGKFYDKNGSGIADAFGALESVSRRLAERHERVERLARTLTASPQTLSGILAEEENALLSIEQCHAEVEILLMQHLYPLLDAPVALDIGANRGDFSLALLRTGFAVCAFEPFPPVYEELVARCERYARFRSEPIGIGAEDGTLELKIVESDGTSDDPSLFSTFIDHDLPDGCRFGRTLPVGVRSLASLRASGEIPPAVGLLKIDTEGNELRVIEGMGDVPYEVVVTESWGDGSALARGESPNRLDRIAQALRPRGYAWFVHIFRRDGTAEPAYFMNWDQQVPASWGNTFFFRSPELFRAAAEWCERFIPRAPIPHVR